MKNLIGTIKIVGVVDYDVPQEFAAWHEVQEATIGQVTNLYADVTTHHGMDDVIVRLTTDPIEWVTISSNYRSHITTSIESEGGGVNVWGADDNNCNGQRTQRSLGFGIYDYYQAKGLDRLLSEGSIEISLLPGITLDEFGYTLCDAFVRMADTNDFYYKAEHCFEYEQFPIYDFSTVESKGYPTMLGYHKDRDGNTIVHIYYNKPRFSSYKFYRVIGLEFSVLIDAAA